MKYESVNIWKLLNSLNSKFGPVARHKGLDFVFEFPAGILSLLVESDIVKLQQVLVNLIGNAIKFTDSGKVKLSCKREGGEVIISVSDSGIGIAKEHYKIIFESFRQADMRSVRSYSGTGLGLYICKTYMDLLGGKIWVESSLGKGSTFSISLPESSAKDPDEPEKMRSVRSTAEVSEIHLLVVEDEKTNFMLLEVYLREIDVRITHAVNGLEALELVRHHEYDLVLMDIQMPVMNGLEATRKIREFNRDIPVIAITAFAFENERIQALDAVRIFQNP